MLYDAENGDDRLLIVVQGLKGLELSSKYAAMFAGKGISSLAMSYYGGEGQPKTMRAIPLEQFRTACETLKNYENVRFRRFGIYGNSKGAGMALLSASVVSDISLVIAASSFGHIMQGSGGILFLTSTNDESVPAKRDAEMLISRLQRMGFAHSYKHINFENGSHNLGYFPINNDLLPQEKKHPDECQKVREDSLEIILQTLRKWGVEQL